MKKALLLTTLALYHYADGKRINGPCSRLSGDCSRLYGNCSGLSGNCSGLSGNCSGLSGDFDDCKISDEDREDGVCLRDLIAAHNADLADDDRVEPVEEEAAQ